MKSFPHLPVRPHGANGLVAFVVSCAFAFLWFQMEPIATTIGAIGAESPPKISEAGAEFGSNQIHYLANDVAIVDGTSPNVDQAKPALLGRDALLEGDRLLAECEAQLEITAGYSATLVKQERIDNALGDVEVIQLRMMHHPKKIALKWVEGRELGQRVVYAQGENGGDMLVRKATGWQARLGILSIAPGGNLALKASRYPVTKSGLLELVKTIREHRAKDLLRKVGVAAKLFPTRTMDGCNVHCLMIEYESPQLAPDENQEYRKALIYIDKQSKFPICVHCYGWPDKIPGSNPAKLDETTLLESYAYKNINLRADISDDEFSKIALR